jgi:transglutaminase-like putative cysteine protease
MKSHRMLSSYALILFSFISLSLLDAQDPPIQWGEIPKADLEMKSYPQDSNATAVILCDYGESSLNNDVDVVFRRHVRIKILTTKGYEWGTFAIRLYTEDHTESIKDIEGATYLLDDRGEVVKKELDEDEVIEEEVDDKHTLCKFTMPGLTPGCVIEVRYAIKAKSLWFIRDWTFQHSEPVRWSEYRVRFPRSIAYSGVTVGYEPFVIREQSEVVQEFRGLRYLFGDDRVPCNQFRWAVRDLPALRNEPYITTIGDYLNKIDVQLAGYAFISTGVKEFMTTWKALVNELVENKNFLEKVDDTRRIRKQAEQLTAGLLSPEEKMRAIYGWVSTSIVWTGQNRATAEQDVDDVLESKKGSSAEITFLLLSLLKSVGIEGDPVILSTRDNGIIQDLYPIVSQFNYVLARVTIGSHYYYLDATDPLRPVELLPTKVLNTRGLVIKRDSIVWVRLTSTKCCVDVSLGMITLTPDGSIAGTLEDSDQDYAALFTRRGLKDKKDVDVAKKEFDADQMGIAIDSVSITGKDSIAAPLKMKAWISSSTYAQSSGDMIYINPHILHRSTDNPFKSKVRKFPIDYSYPRSYASTVVLVLPDSFAVKALPPDRSLYVGSSFLTYSQRVKSDSSQVRITNKLEIRETTIKPARYDELKNFYSQIVAIESGQLVLERIKPPAAPAQNVKSDAKASKKRGKK